jgi:hypothetical protein
MSEKSRSAAKSKAERLTSAGDPHQKVDGSSWTPPEQMENQAQTGMRVLSRGKYRRGGKVQGEAAKMHAGRKPRKSGGAALSADSLINRDVKEANQEREGIKHKGGFAAGGRSGKFMGGPMVRPELQGRPGMGAAAPVAGSPVGQRPGVRPMMRAKGGKVHKDEAQDRKLIKSMTHGKDCDCAKCSGGRVGHAKGGSVALEGGTRPTGGRMARKGGGRASAKKGTTVNVIIASGQKPAMPPPGMAPPPGAGPVGLHQAPPPAMAAAGAPPMGPPAGMPPPQMRKRGGRTGYPIDSGAGGGLGRLEKIEAYG